MKKLMKKRMSVIHSHSKMSLLMWSVVMLVVVKMSWDELARWRGVYRMIYADT